MSGKKILLFTFAVVLGAAAILYFRPKHKVDVVGNGILMPGTGRLYALNTRVNGSVRKLNVKPGDSVKVGELIGEIGDHEYAIQLTQANKKVEELTAQYDTLKDQIDRESAALTNSLEAQLSSSEFNLEKINRKVEVTEDLLATRRLLLEKGLISEVTVSSTESALADAEVQRETVKSGIASIQYNMTKGYRVEDLQSLSNRLADATIARDILQMRKRYYGIQSPWDGQILELDATEGQIVSRGQMLLLMAVSNHEPDEVFAYIPITHGKKIKTGDTADVSFSGFTIQGRVARVSEFAVTDESLVKRYYSANLIRYLTDGKPVLEVVLTLKKPGFKWGVTTGSVAKVKFS